MNNQFQTSAIGLIFILLLLSSGLSAEGGGKDSPNGSSTDWVQYAASKRVIVPDYLDINGNAYISEIGSLVEFKIDLRFIPVKCCRFVNEKHSWCDRGLQDKRC